MTNLCPGRSLSPSSGSMGWIISCRPRRHCPRQQRTSDTILLGVLERETEGTDPSESIGRAADVGCNLLIRRAHTERHLIDFYFGVKQVQKAFKRLVTEVEAAKQLRNRAVEALADTEAKETLSPAHQAVTKVDAALCHLPFHVPIQDFCWDHYPVHPEHEHDIHGMAWHGKVLQSCGQITF